MLSKPACWTEKGIPMQLIVLSADSFPLLCLAPDAVALHEVIPFAQSVDLHVPPEWQDYPRINF